MRYTFYSAMLVSALTVGSMAVSAQHVHRDTSRPARSDSAKGTAVDTLLAAQLAQGKQLVTTVCSACHTEQPPPKLAPPLAHVSRRYRMQHQGDREQALARIVAWIKAPAKDKSLMPAMAIERFGLMAPLPLPDEQLRAAAAYVWSLSEGDSTMSGMGGMGGTGDMRGMGGGQGMPHGRGHDMSKMKDTTDANRRQFH